MPPLFGVLTVVACPNTTVVVGVVVVTVGAVAAVATGTGGAAAPMVALQLARAATTHNKTLKLVLMYYTNLN